MRISQNLTKILLDSGALKFGDFITKSGRPSPYFINTGHLCTSATLKPFCAALASLIAENFGAVDGLLGPAYKGISLAVMTSDLLSDQLNKDVFFTFDRKESKDHGEGGSWVGHQFKGGEKVVIVEDILTRGTSLRTQIPRLRELGVQVAGAVILLDREEQGVSEIARVELQKEFDLPIYSVLKVTDLLESSFVADEDKDRVKGHMKAFSSVPS